MKEWHLAQLNIASLTAPIDSPQLAGFVDNLDRINQLAEKSPGFVWRLQIDVRNTAVPEKLFGKDVIVNMSTWENIDLLHDYVYRSAHAQIMARRIEWFERAAEMYSVLWWVPGGHRPTMLEARKRLDVLRSSGPCEEAFTFKSRYACPAN